MPQSQIDILAIGDAIVDVIGIADDAFLEARGLRKGMMQVVDEAGAEALHAAMGSPDMTPGGSAANTVACAAALGLAGAFVGKVRDDPAGRLFSSGMALSGVLFPVPPAGSGVATSRCLVVVTPDGERTMSTHLGACQTLGIADVDADLVRAARHLYLEGYAWGSPGLAEACLHAAGIARTSGAGVALTLSDPSCAESYRETFLGLARSGGVSVLFANEREACALAGTDDADAAIAAIARLPVLGVVTRGGRGCVVCDRGEIAPVPARPVARVVDTTGAGDAFAGGFMAGHARGLAPTDCAALGTLAASHVIAHVGARPRPGLAALAVAERLLPDLHSRTGDGGCAR